MTPDDTPNNANLKTTAAGTDRFDAMIKRSVAADADNDTAIGARALARLAAAPLPAQRGTFLSRWWPDALLNLDFAPAWPRIAGLACAGAFGIAIGLFGVNVAPRDSAAVAAPASVFVEADLGPLAASPEALTGALP
ncbi:MAG: hypothetical protein AB7K64_14270 [Variibacter sp.]